jgi:hypothetical protein
MLGCWLRAVGEGVQTRVRIALGTFGDELFPSQAESERKRRKTAETERDAALLQVTALREELARLKRTTNPR